MTNEWQLSYFYIRENSTIYLEFLQVIDKVKINKKLIRKILRKIEIIIKEK